MKVCRGKEEERKGGKGISNKGMESHCVYMSLKKRGKEIKENRGGGGGETTR